MMKQETQHKFKPTREFEEIPTVTAKQDGIKNITLYPNIESRVSQYVRLELPQNARRCNVLFEKYPSKINLKDINLDLEDGYVVSQNYQREEKLPIEQKESLFERWRGRQVTFIYIKDGDVKRTYSGELLGRHGVYFLKESGGVGRGYNLSSLPKPDQIIFHGYQDSDQETTEDLNPTKSETNQACFKIQVANARENLEDKTHYGLFHYNCPGFEWNMYCTLILADSQEDRLESFSVYADINNKSGVDFKNIENIKFVLGNVKTVGSYHVNRPQEQRRNFTGDLHYSPIVAKSQSVSSNHREAQSLATQHTLLQKHLGGVGTFTVSDVTDLRNNDTTSVLFYRDINIPVTRRFIYDLSRDTISNDRFKMKLEINQEQHDLLHKFIPSNHIIIKARHPDDSLLDLAESTDPPIYQDDMVSFNGGHCDEIRLSQVVVSEKYYEDHETRTEHWKDKKKEEVVKKDKRISCEEFHHEVNLTNRNTQDRELELLIQSDRALGWDDSFEGVTLELEPDQKSYRVKVLVKNGTNRKMVFTSFKVYKYDN